jgi:hypothetical protein
MKLAKSAPAMEAVKMMSAAECEKWPVFLLTDDLLRWLNAFSDFSD